MPFHEEMLCTVTRIEYDFDKRLGQVWSPQNSVPDLSGSTKYFERIDPQAQRIEHYEGDTVTTIYAREASNEWKRVYA